MFFRNKDLELHSIEFREKFEPGAIDLGLRLPANFPGRNQRAG